MPQRNRAKVAPRVGLIPAFLMIVLALLVAGALFVGSRMLFAPRPQFSLGAPFDLVGRQAPLVLHVKDRAGLKSLRATVVQGDTEQVIVEQVYDPPRPEVEIKWVPAQDPKVRLKDGPGRLKVVARNVSWGGFFKGRAATFTKDFTARLVPPRIEVLTRQHYVNLGGCDMVVYKVTPPEADSGVVVGPAFFKGFPLPGAADPAVRFSLFALPYDADPATPIRLRARDEAQNETISGFWVKVFPRTFRTREIELDDAFLNKVVPEIMSQTPSVTDQGDLLKNFLAINRDLRQANNRELAELAAKSRPEFLWKEPFLQLGNSQVEASFADHRIYKYRGQVVDRQDHLGYDLATVAHAPVAASNDGVALMARYFGIYGNTIVLDHGYGLLSVYGHLNAPGVKEDDRVQRGQTIGQSGETGLAGGDHLHFSMILQGTQVDAREWWDPHWIHDRIQVKLEEFGQAEAAQRIQRGERGEQAKRTQRPLRFPPRPPR
jgi:murein DD-endopeptidase MepM/ murein hydrolase activator NlpD